MRNNMAYCKGCGIKLQNVNKNELGYTPKKDGEYCERCFRITHYGDLTISMRKGISSEEVIKEINDIDGILFWIVDLFDFEASMISGLNRKLNGKDIILVGTKRDLLPETLGDDKLIQFIYKRLNEYGIEIKDILFTSIKNKKSINKLKEYIEELNEDKIVFLGRSNVGKSTLLNHLLDDETLTTSRYPGTTLKTNMIQKNGKTYIDTPGVEIENSYLMQVKEETLKTIIPKTRIKPKVYQLKGDQSFALGGLARIDLYDCDKASIVFYISESLNIHRSKVENADDNWQKHYGKLFEPTAINDEWRVQTYQKEEDKIDIVIYGLGWFSLHGDISKIVVKANKEVNVVYRKAML